MLLRGPRLSWALIAFAFVATLAACGGGGGGGSTVKPAVAQPTPTSTPTGVTQALSASGGTIALPAGELAGASITFPASDMPAGVDVTFSTNQSGAPSPQNRTRRTLSASAIAVYVMTFSGSSQSGITFSGSITLQYTGTTTGLTLEVFDDANLVSVCPESVSNGVTTFTCSNVTINLADTYYLEIVSGSNVTPTPSPSPTPTPSPSPSPSPAGFETGPAATLAPIPYYTVGATKIGFGPYSVANAFNYLVQSGWNGSGVTVAIVGNDLPNTSDISTYVSQFGSGFSLSNYSTEAVDGGGSDASTLGEATLDVETVAGLAPGAKIIFYNTTDTGFADAFNQMVSDQQSSGAPTVVSISFGGCEGPSTYYAYDEAVDAIFAQGAAQGMAFIASAGDQGDECYDGSGFTFGPNFFATDPNVIAVGGTETAAAGCGVGTIASTTAWNDECDAGPSQGATGGGVSALFTSPPYQSGLGVSSTYRNEPDVALPAEYTATYQSGWGALNGTSWSAPQLAALTAQIYQYCRTAIQNPIQLYYYAYQHGTGTFTDVTSGNNQFGSDSTYYTAATGFDNVSGMGIPVGTKIAQTVCPGRSPTGGLTSALRAPANYAAHGSEQPTLVHDVPRLQGLSDHGVRNGSTQTRIVLTLRNTSTLAQDEQAVTAALVSAGFSIVKTYANHLVIDAQAPASVVSSYFQTEMHDFAQPKHGMRYANVYPAVLPATIAPYVRGVILDNIVIAIPLKR